MVHRFVIEGVIVGQTDVANASKIDKMAQFAYNCELVFRRVVLRGQMLQYLNLNYGTPAENYHAVYLAELKSSLSIQDVPLRRQIGGKVKYLEYPIFYYVRRGL